LKTEHQRRLCVLTVLLDVPLPADTGLNLRQLALLKLIRRLGCDSHAFVFTNASRPRVPDELSDHCDGFLTAGPRVEYGALSTLARLSLRARMIGPAMSGRPSLVYPFSVQYDLICAVQRIAEATKEIGADVVVLPTMLLHVAPTLTNAGVLVIGDAIDIVSQLTWRFLQYGKRKPWRIPGLLVNHLATRSQESLFLSACSEIWATTDEEAALLRKMAPAANVLVAGNALDERVVKSSDIPPEGPIGFIGNYSLAPNLDAARFLVEQVFPYIERRRPGTRLALAGTGMPVDIRTRFQTIPGVQVLGRVEDSVAFIQSSRVMALPIRVRGGLPLKLVEALACGRPVVATPQLVQGLPLREGRDVLIGADADTLASAVCDVLDNPSVARSLAKNGRRRFEEEFSFQATIRRLEHQSVLVAGRR
jgi:glycosyltransferase involved in cell wall biosynthesis